MVETRLATRDARQSRSVVRCRIAAIIARLMPMPETPTMAYFTISLGTRRAIPLRDGRWGLVAVSSSGPTIVLELIVRGNSELLNKDNPECQAPPTRIRVTKPVPLDPDTAPEQECSAQLQAFRNASRYDGGIAMTDGKAVVAVMLVLLTGTAVLHGQTFRGTILGTVTDPSGAVVSGAKVTVRNVATGLERTTLTSGDGSYTIPELPIGT